MGLLAEVIALRAEVAALKEAATLWSRRSGGVPCLHCGNEMIVGGAHGCEDEEEYIIVTNASCPKCGGFLLFYTPPDGPEYRN